MIRIGLVGYGRWGRNVYRVLSELGVLHSVYDIATNSPNQVQSYELMLSYKDLDAVVIATPAKTHYDLCQQALLAGKHVLVEKPMALRFADGVKLVNLAKRKERILMVGHLLQYHPAIAKLKGLIQNEVLGELRYLYSNRLNLGILRTEESVVWSFAPHDISVILSLVSDNRVEVSAFGGSYINTGIFDTTILALNFANGIKAHIYVSWLHPYKVQELTVIGSKAIAVFDGVKNELTLQHYTSNGDSLNGSQKEIIKTSKEEPLKLELRHFIDCINSHTEPLTDGREGLRVLEILTHAGYALNTQNSLC